MSELPLDVWGFSESTMGYAVTPKGLLRFIRYRNHDVLALDDEVLGNYPHPPDDAPKPSTHRSETRRAWDVALKVANAA